MADANPKDGRVESSQPAAQTRNTLGTFGGVFTPTLLTILGVIMFMRANFVVGEAGVQGAILILCLATGITFLTSLSLSAISTNMQVRGGGSYFLISRVLGPEFGGAIGISLFLATALSAPFYIIGFIESLTLTFPQLDSAALWISLATAMALFVISYVGANWAIRVQYGIMAVLLLATAAFLVGSGMQFSPDTLTANWRSGYTPIDPSLEIGKRYSFWLIFAIYFPAVTGINAGLNMSGDLKDPNKSLPKGTILAIAAGFLIYLAQIILSGGAYSREALINEPFQLLVDNAFFGLGFLVVGGVFAATLSSALGSMLGAPRVLQALARDPILNLLHPFAKGSDKGDEPRRALVLTVLISLGVLWWAFASSGGNALNAIAAIITMFFLYTYGMINLAAFIEAFGRNPSFRPRFKFFHWFTALLGGLGCVFAAFLINTVAATIAAIVITLLVVHLFKTQTQATFGDARRGFVYSSARKNLLQLNAMEEDAKNWRPTLLVFSGNPKNREELVTYAIWLSSGRGIVFLADILVGKIKELANHRKAGLKRLKDFCREKRLQAFPLVMVEESVERGVSTLIQTAGSGMVTPNLAVFGWCDDRKNLPTFLRQLRQAREMGLSVMLIKTHHLPYPTGKKQIHIWWRGKTNGRLMMILGFLLQDNWEWGNSQIQVLRAVEEQQGIEPALDKLNELINNSRIEADAKVVPSVRTFNETLHDYSADADCVFLGFEIPEEGQEEGWYDQYEAMLKHMPTSILINSAIEDDLLE